MNGDRSTNETLATVPEAAKILHISPEAVRARLNRGTLQKEKGEDGTTYVRLNADQTQSNYDRTNDQTDHIPPLAFELLQDQIAFLRAELERKDAIIMSLTQRIPELESAKEPPDTRQTPGEGPDRVVDQAPKAEEPERRPSWWRRMFGS